MGDEPLTIEAEFDNAGEKTVEGRPVGKGNLQHFFIGTDDHDTLLDAKVVIPGESGGKLVLSHVAYDEVEEPNDGILEVTKVIETDFGEMPPILMAENENTEEEMEFEIEIEKC